MLGSIHGDKIMYDAPQTDSQPASHYEYVLKAENRDLTYGIKQEAFGFMNQLEGWCSDRKAGILIDLIFMTAPRVIVEIGVYGGKSLVPMACALKANRKGIIYGIDPWDTNASLEDVMNASNRAYWGWVDHEAIMNRLIQKIDQFELQGRIELIRRTSANTDPIYDIDILHVDGNHSDSTSYLDVTKWVPLMKKGGWIIFDDMTWYEDGIFTTSRAVEWLNKNCIKVAEYTDDSIWGMWVKP